MLEGERESWGMFYASPPLHFYGGVAEGSRECLDAPNAHILENSYNKTIAKRVRCSSQGIWYNRKFERVENVYKICV